MDDLEYERCIVKALGDVLTSQRRRLTVHWDMDGTLVDSEPLHVRKLIAVCARHGIVLTEAHFSELQHFSVPSSAGGAMEPAQMALHGAGDKNVYFWALAQRAALAQELNLAQWLDALMAFYLAEAKSLELRPGIANLVGAMHAAGMSQDIVTSATSAQLAATQPTLRALGSAIEFVIDGDGVLRPKPHPDGYLAAQKRANAHWSSQGIDLARVTHVAIEDSPTGVRAALNAGMDCIQFLLPGQWPVPEADESKVMVAETTADIIDHLARLLA